MDKQIKMSERLRLGEHRAYYITIDGVVHDRRCLEAADLMDECENALEAIIEFRASRTLSGSIVGIDEQYPDVVIAMKALAKLQKEQADETNR